MYEETLKETAGKQNLRYILPEAKKKLGCLQFPNINHRTPVCYAVWIMQARHTMTHAHEAVTRKTTGKEMGTKKQGHQVCETKLIIA
jgi:hypothetical protein